MPTGAPGDRALVIDVESKIDFTVIPGVSAIESKLDLWDARARAESFSRENMAEAYLSLYREVLLENEW